MAARIRELIRASVADPGAGDVSGGELTADDLAAAAGCSRFAAYRAFRQAYGLSPSDAMKERASAPGGCWKLPSIRLHQGTGGPR